MKVVSKDSDMFVREFEYLFAERSEELRLCTRGLSLHLSKYSMVLERHMRDRLSVCLSVCLFVVAVAIELDLCVLLFGHSFVVSVVVVVVVVLEFSSSFSVLTMLGCSVVVGVFSILGI